MDQQRISFIGGGQMAEAMLRAIELHDSLSIDQITIMDINQSRLNDLHHKYKVRTTLSLENALHHADLIIIAVRPQDNIAAIGVQVQRFARKDATILSIVAGVTLEKLESYFGKERPVIRVIPNTLTVTGYGYSGVTMNHYASKETVDDFLQVFGKVQYLEETLMDAYTGYGVAGANYVYYFIESLADAGVMAGLPREMAWKLALENLTGAAAMLQKTGLHPRQLLDINNSPGGVGINALYELNQSDFAAGLQRSVLRAVSRTTELGAGN
jgi:pyrroline-5-carboxylate reductase